MDTRQSIQKQIRDSFENAYKERMLTMKNFYEMIYQTLQQTIGSSYKKILQDQILTAMVRDTTTVNYLEDRVKQLFKQIVENEREVLIEKLGLQYSQLKFHYQELQRKHANLKKQSENTQQRSYKDRISSQTERSEVSEMLRKKDQQIFELKLQQKQKLLTIKQKQRMIEDYQNKLNQFKEQNTYLKANLHKFEQQVSQMIGDQKTKFELKDVDLRQSQKKLSLLQNTIKEIQKANQEKIELIQKKYRKKIGQYKQKIQQYKAKILQLVNQKPTIETNHHYQSRVQQLQRKIISINRQSQKKVSQLKSQKQKDKTAMERKYQAKYKQLQSYYEKLMEEKIQQSEKVAYEAAERIRQQEQQIKKYVQYLEQNSSPAEQYQKLQLFCQNLKQHLQNKILQNQKMSSYFTNQNKQLQLQMNQTRKNLQQAKNRIEQLQSFNKQMTDKIKAYDQQLNQFKMSQKKLKTVLMNSEASMRMKEEQILNLRNQINKIRYENTEYIGTIGERENLFLQKAQESEQMQKRINKLSKELQMIGEQKQKIQATLSSVKRSLIQKENGILTLTQQNQYKIETLNAQIHKYNLTIQSNAERIKQLTQKNANLEGLLANSSKQKNELQTNVRRLELQNKFVKQSQESFKKQHEMYMLDYKKKIQQKIKNAQEIQLQYNQSKKDFAQQSQIKDMRIRKLAMIIKKVHRIYSSEMDNLKRNLKDIRIYAESVQKLLKSEIKLLQSNASLKLKEEMLAVLSSKNQQIRKIKQSLQHEKNQHINSSKQKSQQMELNLKDKLQLQIRNYSNLISTKQNEIAKLDKQIKRYMVQKDEILETSRNLQKKIKDIELAYENEKIQGKSKINQIIRSFDTEKSKIIQQFQLKMEKQQNQLDQLSKILKNLRKQLQNSKLQNQKYKNQLISQTNAFNKKQILLQKEIQKKTLQIENLNQQLRISKDSVNKLDNQLKLIIQRNKSISQSLAESQLKNHQITGELAIVKAKSDRLSEQNQQIKRQLTQKDSQSSALERSKKKMESELRQIKSTINKSNKSHELRALQQLDIQTKQLTNKVSQLRKIDYLMSQDRTPLRS